MAWATAAEAIQSGMPVYPTPNPQGSSQSGGEHLSHMQHSVVLTLTAGSQATCHFCAYLGFLSKQSQEHREVQRYGPSQHASMLGQASPITGGQAGGQTQSRAQRRAPSPMRAAPSPQRLNGEAKLMQAVKKVLQQCGYFNLH